MAEPRAPSNTNNTASQLYRFTFVLIVTLLLIAAFLFVIRRFLLDILLAAIFAGLLSPIVQKCLPLFGNRRSPAVVAVVVAAALAVALPVLIVIAVVGTEAVQFSEHTIEWLRASISSPEPLAARLPAWLSSEEWFRQAIDATKSHVAEIATAFSGFVTRRLSAITHVTLFFLLDLFVILFALIYFLRRGSQLVDHLIDRIPIDAAEASTIVTRTLVTTSAALKSIVVVGLAQGSLIGLAFAVVGFDQPWFWGTMAALASTVPGLGSSLVWIPAAIYLMASGKIAAGIGLLVWGGVVITLADNLLRVYIVGRSAALPGFLVFISTLGGLTAFGPAGVLVGPMLVGVLLGVLDLYQAVLQSTGLASTPEAEAP